MKQSRMKMDTRLSKNIARIFYRAYKRAKSNKKMSNQICNLAISPILMIFMSRASLTKSLHYRKLNLNKLVKERLAT
jgi:hypothetical protein